MFKNWAFLSLFCVVFLSGCNLIPTHKQYDSVQLSGKVDITRALLAQHDAWQGTPYELGGVDREGIDCSAFTQVTYRQLFSISIPRTTESQAYFGESIPKSHLRPGDLILFRTNGVKQRHVGIFVSENLFVHASTSKGVTLSKLDNPYWQKHYWKSIRPKAMQSLQNSL